MAGEYSISWYHCRRKYTWAIAEGYSNAPKRTALFFFFFLCSSSGMEHCSQSPCRGRRHHFKFILKRRCLIWVLRQPLAGCIRYFLLHVCYLSGFSFYIIPVLFFISGLAWEDESWWVELAKRWCKVVGRLGHSWLLVWESAANLELGFYPGVPLSSHSSSVP